MKEKYITREIVLGTENLEGELLPVPFGEKGLETDWIERFLFEESCVSNSCKDRICGYVELDDEDMLCEASWWDLHVVRYEFPAYNFLDKRDIDIFEEKLREFFKLDEFTIKIYIIEQEHGSIHPRFNVAFYSRREL